MLLCLLVFWYYVVNWKSWFIVQNKSVGRQKCFDNRITLTRWNTYLINEMTENIFGSKCIYFILHKVNKRNIFMQILSIINNKIGYSTTQPSLYYTIYGTKGSLLALSVKWWKNRLSVYTVRYILYGNSFLYFKLHFLWYPLWYPM